MRSINRRHFLANAALAGVVLRETAGPPAAKADGVAVAQTKWRGVNLGGWLVLEKWITPSLYAGTEAEDEYTLCESLGKAKAAERLEKHRATWITAEDFRWLAERGINALRLPVSYGVARESPPFLPAFDRVDWAFRTAGQHGIGILLDLHGAPGSQNGWDHSGRQGQLGWHTSRQNIDETLRILADLATRCKGYDNLLGIELLNEPRWDVPMEILRAFYQDAYHRMREPMGKERAIVIHDGFRQLQWKGFMQEPEYANVLLDTHPYQCFTDDDRKRDLHGQVAFALQERKKLLDEMKRQLPCIVGEWSCALPPESLGERKGFELDVAMRAYGDAQLVNFDATRGWFFWTYKTEEGGAWSFRDCVRRGWLPDRYGASNG
jgi:glucan 1,3-beta-glucosidase